MNDKPYYLKVDEFIENCSEQELAYLWEQVNSKEFIGMISDELKNQVEIEMIASGAE
jgi:hypothetical protein